ncbi:MAG: Hsp20/alpha crystallin family protein [Clostridiales bacterium]|uniref:HSP20 family protein n=1 Tax=Harryflintia acetispora TaxID=1849041 RepID=A0A9X8UIZ5_9FIRM|nr:MULTISPECIES: Hsp20/alpha crystallin family protein [Oscillospiraceae]PWM40544.1 MAG: Hsp20/alpha crystallin family protein [Clostridiales bacterium]RGB67883.1 Hsp20/alpha crystallin family protein [Harryflintia acetispora]TCL43406.1 HSP20 family protein [Harryflintia acetispora]
MFDLMPFARREKNLFDALSTALNDDFWGSAGRTLSQCKTDVLDRGDHFLVQAELPGFKKEDISIDINGDYLTLRAQHSEEKKEEKDNYVCRERSYGGFSRSFDVSGVKVDEITASYENGVLELKMPKRGEAKPDTRKIEIR